MEKKILLGLHTKDKDKVDSLIELSQREGYSVDLAKTREEMLDKVRAAEYDRYFMDANLGKPASSDVSSSVVIYGLVKERAEKGLAKFLAVSGNQLAIDNAKEKGIPAELKGTISFSKFLK